MKRLLFCFVLVLAVSGLVFAAGEKEGAEAGGEEITSLDIILWNPPDQISGLFNYIESQIPVEFEIEIVGVENLQKIILTRLEGGRGPDVFMLGGWWTTFANAGYLLPLNNEPFIDNYFETGLDAYTLDDVIYGVPQLSWHNGIYYNKRIFKENNLEIPRDIDEFINVCNTLEDAGIKPLTMQNGKPGPINMYVWGYMLNTFYQTEKGKNFDTRFDNGDISFYPALEPYLEDAFEIFREGIVDEETVGIGHDQAIDEFMNERSAMWIGGGDWSIKLMQDKNPDAYDNMGYFPFFGDEADTGWLVGGPGGGFAVNKNSDNLEMALKALEVASAPEAQHAFYETKKSGTSYVKGVEFDMNPIFKDASDAIQAGNIHAPWKIWFGGQHVIDTLWRNFQQYLLGDKTEADILRACDKKAQEVRQTRRSGN